MPYTVTVTGNHGAHVPEHYATAEEGRAAVERATEELSCAVSGYGPVFKGGNDTGLLVVLGSDRPGVTAHHVIEMKEAQDV